MDDSKLVELVRGNPCLFNTQHPHYKDANARENVWSEIAEELESTAEDCKRRWKNIRDTYMRRKRPKKLSSGSESFRRRKKLRKWHLEKHLQFLNVVDCEIETVTNAITEEETLQDLQETEAVEFAVETDDIEFRETEELEEGLCQVQCLEPDHSEGDSVQSKKRKSDLSGESILKVVKKNSEERAKLMSNILDKSIEQPKEQHPIDLFFQSMAMTVKTFSPANQIRARMEICRVVSQLELEEVNLGQNDPQYDASAFCNSTLHLPSLQYDH